MLELMNLAALEVNARRRVEVITETMRASRRRRGPAADDAPSRPAAVASRGREAGCADCPAADSAAA